MYEKRVPTGIDGFDEISGGGLIKDRTYLVSGTAGAGKTIFSLEYLYNGITKYGESGIFLATEEPPRQLRQDAQKFGWDLEKLEDENKLALMDGSSTKIGVPTTEKVIDEKPYDLESLLDKFIALQEEMGAQRAVIDSATAIAYHIQDPAKTRNALLKLSSTLKILDLTTLVTRELEHNPSVETMENFIVDGVIVLYFRRVLDTRIHSVEIYKMRGAEHSNKIHPFQISSNGMTVNSSEGVYGEF